MFLCVRVYVCNAREETASGRHGSCVVRYRKEVRGFGSVRASRQAQPYIRRYCILTMARATMTAAKSGCELLLSELEKWP